MDFPAPLPDTPCYLNGSFTPLSEAKISVLDRGFIFGDGAYDVVPVYAGRAFRVAQHMARLERSLGELRIANPLSRDGWHDVVRQLVAGQPGGGAGDHLVYLQVTRGVAMRDHSMLPGLTPTVFAMASPIKPPSAAQRAEGVACITAEDFRWQKAHIKSTSLLGAVFARQLSVDAGVAETVMFRGEWLSEAAACNVWVIKNGTVMGPPRDHLVLEGIRYGLIESLCRQAGVGFELRPISRAEVVAADELLLSSASKEVLPVTLLDGQPVGNGLPGPIYEQLYAGYQRAKQEEEALT